MKVIPLPYELRTKPHTDKTQQDKTLTDKTPQDKTPHWQNPTGQNPTLTKPHRTKPHTDKTPQDKTPHWQNPTGQNPTLTKPHRTKPHQLFSVKDKTRLFSIFPEMIIFMINITLYIIKYTFIYIELKLYFDTKNFNNNWNVVEGNNIFLYNVHIYSSNIYDVLVASFVFHQQFTRRSPNLGYHCQIIIY